MTKRLGGGGVDARLKGGAGAGRRAGSEVSREGGLDCAEISVTQFRVAAQLERRL